MQSCTQLRVLACQFGRSEIQCATLPGMNSECAVALSMSYGIHCHIRDWWVLVNIIPMVHPKKYDNWLDILQCG